jgi:hypothetical protein
VETGLEEPPRNLTLSDSAVYRIRVQGVLEPSWSEFLHGMAITTISQLDERRRDSPQTELMGTLADQAALIGLINTLYSLGMPLIFVKCVRRSEQS